MKIYFPSNLVPKTVIKVCVPSENDVLKCNWKDNYIENHNGNMLLKDLVKEKYNDYKDMTNLQKARLFDSIRGIMKEKHGSKYWKQEEGAWVEMVDDDEAMEHLTNQLNHWWNEAEQIPDEMLKARIVLIFKGGSTKTNAKLPQHCFNITLKDLSETAT